MNEQYIQNAPKYDMRNRVSIDESEVCGCYHCCNTFSKLDIIEWTDGQQTAICPHCSIDSVIAQSFGVPLDEEHLLAMHNYWFKN